MSYSQWQNKIFFHSFITNGFFRKSKVFKAYMGCDDYETIVMQIVFEGMSFYSDDKRLFFCELFLYAVHHAFVLELKIYSKLLCNFQRNKKYFNKADE